MILINMKSIENNFGNYEVNKLLKKHFVELRSVSPLGSTHVLDIGGLKTHTIKFWSFWNKNQLIGCGALKFLNQDHGEFKSIRISDEFRNKDLGRVLILDLIEKAKNNNIKKISVETGAGKFFLPARKLFLKCGFKPSKPFAHYTDDPNSCYYYLDI